MTQISDAVLSLDLTAADLARAQGAAAIPELTPFLTHSDSAVRMVAVVALGEIAHPDAYQALMQAAQDEDDMVAGTAVEKLGIHAAAIGAEPLVQLLRRIGSDPARAHLVLIVGRMVNEKQTESLAAFCRRNQGADTKRACLAALARLDVENARNDFAQYLLQAKDLVAFEMADYISQPWLLPPLGQLLRDKETVQTLGDPPPGFPATLRVCDKAVVLIAKISGRRFSFPTDVHMNYDDKQLAEAAAAAGRMAP